MALAEATCREVAMLKRIPASAKRTIYSFLAMDSEVTSQVKTTQSCDPGNHLQRRSWSRYRDARKYFYPIQALPVHILKRSFG